MNNFNFYFRVKKDKKVSLNKGGNVAEIELDDYGQGMLFSSQEFQETRFQTLTLPVTPQVRKVLLENEITDKRMVIKEVWKEPTLAKVDEKNIKLTADTFGAVEMVNSENENPFSPFKIDWDNWWDGYDKRKKAGWKSWRMWWNPRDMKFWNPPLTSEEQEKYLKSKYDDYLTAWEVYKNRFNQQKHQLDLYFQVNTTDKYYSQSSNPDRSISDEWEIRFFCWPPFTPPSVISELIPNWSERREEFTNCVIGEIDLIFDNRDEKNMKLFHQWDNLLAQVSPQEKFVIRNIPLQIRETSFRSLDEFHDLSEYNWQSWNEKSKLENQPPQQREKWLWRNHENSANIKHFEMAFQGKVVQRMTIYTKNLEEQLKLEKVSEEEYNNKINNENSREFNNWKNKLRQWMEENKVEEIILKEKNSALCKKCNGSGSFYFGGEPVGSEEIPENLRTKINGVDIGLFFEKNGKNSITRQELGLSNSKKTEVNHQSNFNWTPWIIGSVMLFSVVILFLIIRKKPKRGYVK